MVERLVLDTSVVIGGVISSKIARGELRDCEVVIPAAVLDELQAQASQSRETGFLGLDELKRIRKLCEERGMTMRFEGERPTMEEIQLAKKGRIDAIIRDVAKKGGGRLVTADYVQFLVAEAEGVATDYHRPEIKTQGLMMEEFFTEDTLSVHLKEGVVGVAKRGSPGKFSLTRLGTEAMTRELLDKLIKEVTEAARASRTGSIEISRHGATVLQLGNYRIAITRPPFSDGVEVTIVRPIVKLALSDYHLSEKLMARLRDHAEGILISGPPGSGKSTLASSMADFFVSEGKIVKTFESPRNLQVLPEVTQYGPLEGDFEKTAEILLLVRPDYTIYDEVRKTRDFEIFADMRLAGVGMVGVVHASEAVDAVQRFIGRVELGMIPHIIDTIIFVKAGRIESVYELSLVVKVPSGMTEADLARPVVEMKDFETDRLVYEIYTFGEENVIIPVKGMEQKRDAIRKLAEERIMQFVRKFDADAKVEIVSPQKAVVRVAREAVPRLIGKAGVTIGEIEDALGIRIDVEAKVPTLGQEIEFDTLEKGNLIELVFKEEASGKQVGLYIDDEFLCAASIGKGSTLRFSRSSETGRRLTSALIGGREVRAYTQAS